MELVDDSPEFDWIRQNLQGWGHVNSIVPKGYASYTRIFNPATRFGWVGKVMNSSGTRTTSEELGWKDSARLTGTNFHPWVQWPRIAGSKWDEVDLGDGTSLAPPEEGDISDATLKQLGKVLSNFTNTPGECFAAVWTGWNLEYLLSLDRQKATSSGMATRIFHLPERDYYLLKLNLAELREESDFFTELGRGPQILWPPDRSWFLAAEVDYAFLVLGGSVALTSAISSSSNFESAVLLVTET